MKALNTCAAGDSARILVIEASPSFQSRAAAVGLTPGSIVDIVQNQRRRPLLIHVRHTLLAIDRRDSADIQVEVAP